MMLWCAFQIFRRVKLHLIIPVALIFDHGQDTAFGTYLRQKFHKFLLHLCNLFFAKMFQIAFIFKTCLCLFPDIMETDAMNINTAFCLSGQMEHFGFCIFPRL